MPSKNSVKQYLEGGFYHVYNRGVDKRIVFDDEMDYKIFLSYLKSYLLPPTPKQVRPVRQSKIFEEVQLICYALMPNHFHLLLKQNTKYGIVGFMRRIGNAYTKYFNERHERVGPLFQGKYKGVLVTEDSYLLHLTRYIHLNPAGIATLDDQNRSDLLSYPYSSYGEYLGSRNTTWIHPEEILAFFNIAKTAFLQNNSSYKSFVEDYQINSAEVLAELTLEFEEKESKQKLNRSDLH
ncbi:MAG: transposase [Candidatus Curtissbacteria bacterium]|nr:transposase [Candidatus Curtissbacteria bacterium]